MSFEFTLPPTYKYDDKRSRQAIWQYLSELPETPEVRRIVTQAAVRLLFAVKSAFSGFHRFSVTVQIEEPEQRQLPPKMKIDVRGDRVEVSIREREGLEVDFLVQGERQESLTLRYNGADDALFDADGASGLDVLIGTILKAFA